MKSFHSLSLLALVAAACGSSAGAPPRADQPSTGTAASAAATGAIDPRVAGYVALLERFAAATEAARGSCAVVDAVAAFAATDDGQTLRRMAADVELARLAAEQAEVVNDEHGALALTLFSVKQVVIKCGGTVEAAFDMTQIFPG